MSRRQPRLSHVLFAEAENQRENFLSALIPNHESYLQQKGVQETNASRQMREIETFTRPLKKFYHTPLGPDDHELEVHQGIYIDPYFWEFQKGKKRFDGTNQLQIGLSYGRPDENEWKVHGGDFFTGTDSEVYNSMRGYKKSVNKNYGLGWRRGHCQKGAYDVRSHLMNGESNQPLPPSSEAHKILFNKYRRDGLKSVVRTGVKSGLASGSYEVSPDGFDAWVEGAMKNMTLEGRKQGWM